MSIHWKSLSTPEKIQAVQSVYRKGASAKLLASYFDGATRNSVIGLYHRYPDKFAGRPLNVPAVITERVVRARRTHRRLPVAKTCQPIPEPKFIPTETHRCGKTLLMLGKHECRWPVNAASGDELHLFCGQVVEVGPYCDFHAGRAYRSPTSSS